MLQVLSVWTATGQEATEGLSESLYPHHTCNASYTHTHTHKDLLPEWKDLISYNFITTVFLFSFSLSSSFPLSFSLIFLPASVFLKSSFCLTNILSLGHPLALCLTHSPSLYSSFFFIPSSPSPFLHSALALFLFSPLSSLLLCRCTAVQRQISVLVPVRQRHGKLHAKTQSANADKGGGVWTSVHTKHQTHLNHKMKWLTSAELENIFLPSLF